MLEEDEKDEIPQAVVTESEILQDVDGGRYVVQSGDSLMKLSFMFGTSKKMIVNLNEKIISNTDSTLTPGMVLKIIDKTQD